NFLWRLRPACPSANAYRTRHRSVDRRPYLRPDTRRKTWLPAAASSPKFLLDCECDAPQAKTRCSPKVLSRYSEVGIAAAARPSRQRAAVTPQFPFGNKGFPRPPQMLYASLISQTTTES